METSSTEVVDDQSLRDTKGRRIMDASRREELLARYKTSGMTQKAFARREGVNFHTLCSWLAKHRRAQSASLPPACMEPSPGAFVELSAPAVHTPAPLEVVLRDGRIVRGTHAATLAALVRLLEG
jgi:transposase-like protein